MARPIKSQHVKDEYQKAVELWNKPETTDKQKLGILFKLITVLLKVVLSIRINTVLLMKKLGVALTTVKREEDTEPTEEEKIEE